MQNLSLLCKIFVTPKVRDNNKRGINRNGQIAIYFEYKLVD